jgi:hypothetical protein
LGTGEYLHDKVVYLITNLVLLACKENQSMIKSVGQRVDFEVVSRFQKPYWPTDFWVKQSILLSLPRR